jgi:hypothetical protein
MAAIKCLKSSEQSVWKRAFRFSLLTEAASLWIIAEDPITVTLKAGLCVLTLCSATADTRVLTFIDVHAFSSEHVEATFAFAI